MPPLFSGCPWIIATPPDGLNKKQIQPWFSCCSYSLSGTWTTSWWKKLQPVNLLDIYQYTNWPSCPLLLVLTARRSERIVKSLEQESEESTVYAPLCSVYEAWNFAPLCSVYEAWNFASAPCHIMIHIHHPDIRPFNSKPSPVHAECNKWTWLVPL